MTPDQQAELDALASLPDSCIKTTDMPEIVDWSAARRGALFRPVKRQLILRLDADLIEWFKQQANDGPDGYQTRINAALRAFVANQQA